jgi:ribosomal protein S18 acetylase RimI-like enzyme
MDFTYQPLTVADDLIVWEMLRHAAHESSVESVQQQPCLARYALDWGKKDDIGWVALGDTRPIGAVWLRLWLGEDKGFGYVRNEIPELAIAVIPDFRGQGVGTELLKRILNTAKTQYSGISLSVRANNPVLGLYERTGFIKIPGSEVINRLGEVSFNMMCEFI